MFNQGLTRNQTFLLLLFITSKPFYYLFNLRHYYSLNCYFYYTSCYNDWYSHFFTLKKVILQDCLCMKIKMSVCLFMFNSPVGPGVSSCLVDFCTLKLIHLLKKKSKIQINKQKYAFKDHFNQSWSKLQRERKFQWSQDAHLMWVWICPKATDWPIIVDVYKTMLHTNYENCRLYTYT